MTHSAYPARMRSSALDANAAVEEAFAADGPLSGVVQPYQVREGQLLMAKAVAASLQRESVLFCEAGTGTGKTLAYLIPAILSGKKVIISTATRALQEQILTKDLLLVERALKRRVSVALMKGLGNYLCLRRFNEFRNSEQASAVRWSSKLRVLDQWRSDTESGDFAELAAMAEGDELVSWINASSETRVGPRCAYFGDCFVTRMRKEAEAAQIVLVNHHLFFADLALRGPHPGRVLPDYDAVVFDEAHQVENVASLFFGVRVSRRRVQTLLSEAERLLRAHSDTVFTKAPAQVAVASERFFDGVRAQASGNEPRVGLESAVWAGPAYQAYLELDTALEALENVADLARSDGSGAAEQKLSDGLDSVVRRCQSLRAALATIVEGAPGRVAWLDTENSGLALSSTPIDIADTLREAVFNRIPSVVLTSATLATSHSASLEADPEPFAFIRARLGADSCEPEVNELVVPSPFDFKQHALLYLPKDLPAPSDAAFAEQALERIAKLVQASDGGAFVLTTSLRSMKLLHRGLCALLPARKVLLQGSSPKSALLSAFRADARAVLVATMGFWEGVDVPGDALRLVILEKIPFSVPSDPILAARSQLLEQQGRNPFNELYLPLAQMSLKQGFGRLIRGEHDRGVVALLDSRVHKRGYGQRLLSQLPPARRVVDLEQTLAFLESTRPANKS